MVFVCHNDRLEELLDFLPLENFRELSVEPSLSNPMIDAGFELDVYKYNNEIGMYLYDYGDDREEIVRNFGGHVLNCFDCYTRYHCFLMGEIYDSINRNHNIDGMSDEEYMEHIYDKNFKRLMDKKLNEADDLYLRIRPIVGGVV